MRRPQRCEPPSEYRPRGRRPCGLCFDPIYRDADFWFDDWSRMLQIRPIDVTGQLRIFVREIQASEAKAHLASLLDAVDRGETIVITRHGKPIAVATDADVEKEALMLPPAKLGQPGSAQT
jgi:prevent-host-death family protein